MHLWFPINKKLWTSSFVIFTAGLALILLAAFYWVSDVKQHRGRWTWPILVFGTNAIAAYFLSEALAAALYSINLTRSNGGARLGAGVYLLTTLCAFRPVRRMLRCSYALAYVAVCWRGMAVLYRKGIRIKV